MPVLAVVPKPGKTEMTALRRQLIRVTEPVQRGGDSVVIREKIPGMVSAASAPSQYTHAFGRTEPCRGGIAG